MKSLIISIFFFLSLTSYAQLRTNNPFVFNVQMFGAKADGVTNDRDAIQAAISACVSYGGGTVYFPYSPNQYVISGALVTSLNSVNPNCQIYIPLVQASSKMVSIKLLGGSPSSFSSESAGGGITRTTQGVILYSTIQGSGTTPAILGSPWYSAGIVGNRNYIEVVIENMEFRTQTKGVTNNDTLGTMSAINASKLLTFSGTELHASISSAIDSSVLPTNETYGIILPDVNNHSKLDFGSIFVEGYKYGIQLSEHSSIKHLTAVGCVNAIKIIDGYHTSVIEMATLEANKNNISVEGSMPLTITNFETEHTPSTTGKWYVNVTDINQVTGLSRIQIFNSGVVKGGVGVVDSFTVAGTPNYVVYNGQGGFRTGYVPFGDNTKYRLNSDATFFWDNTNKRLGLGTTTPSERLHLYSSGNSGAYIETSASGNEAYLHFRSGGVGIANLETFGSTFANGAFQNAIAFTSLVNNTGTINFLTTTSGTAVSRLKINNSGTVTFNNAYTLPSAAGSNNDVLTTNGSGTVSWAAPPAYWTLASTSLYPNSTTYNVGIGNTSPGVKLDVTAAQGYIAKFGDGTRDLRVYTNTGYSALGSSHGGDDVKIFVDDDVNKSITVKTTSANVLMSGKLFVNGSTTPTAKIHIAAGGASASTAPIKLTAGTVLTTPESGVIETDANNELYYSTSTTTASRGYVQVNRYVAKTATYTATANDETIDCTSGTFTVTLPTAVGISGRAYKIVNSGSGTITIATTSSQTFTNITSTPTTLTLAAVAAGAIVEYDLTSTGAAWIVTGKVKNE